MSENKTENKGTNELITQYWADNYVGKMHCSLCGNTGVIDTTETAITPAGFKVGRLNWCICPSGQLMRGDMLPRSIEDRMLGE